MKLVLVAMKQGLIFYSSDRVYRACPGMILLPSCFEAFCPGPGRQPPEVEVPPLPLFVGFIPDLSGLAFCELAAGSPVTDPCRVPCATASV
jgi:hypothetical protein